MSPGQTRHPKAVAGFLLLLLLCTLAYWQGLNGPFVFDDASNLLDGPFPDLKATGWAGLWHTLLVSEAGPLRRPLSMLSFGLNALTTGMQPFGFKLTNLAIHLLNGALVWRVVVRLLAFSPAVPASRRPLLALLATGLWLLHPLQLTSVLYVVQRMTSLSATFVLAGLVCYLRARAAQIDGRDARTLLWVGVSACLVLAALTKENGVLLIAYCLAIELSLLRFRDPRGKRTGSLRQFYGVFLCLPLALGVLHLVRHPEMLTATVPWRDFSPLERVLTESRVLFFYLKLLFVPDISEYGLFYDDFTVSRGLLAPASTLVSLLAWLGLVVVALAGRRRWPWFSFAVCWYLAGHVLESSFVMLELVHLHRNYLPCLGPLLALAVGLDGLLVGAAPRLPALVLGAMVLVLALVTALRADQWRDPVTLARYELLHRPGSPRAQYEGGRILANLGVALKNPALTQDAIAHLRQSAALAPNDVGALLAVGIIAGGPFPDADFNALKRRLRQRAMHDLDLAYLRAFMNCPMTTPCQVPAAQTQELLALMLDHPGLTTQVRAELLALLGSYYARHLGDIEACVRLIREAVALLPDNALMRLNFAQALLLVPDYAAAEAALAEAERLDYLGVQAPEIQRVRTDIARMRTAARKGHDNG